MLRSTLRPQWCLLCALTLAISLHAVEQTAQPQVPESSVYRLRLRTADGEYMVTGFGTAFGIDLNSYGIGDSKYLLSAAHLVLAKTGSGLAKGDLEIELPNGAQKVWTRCEVVSADKKRDLCLLKCTSALPGLCKLQNKGIHVGEKVMIVGCPEGVQPRVSMGRLTDKTPNVGGELWEAAAKFYHGNSGGPVFDPKAGTVLGVAVAGVSNGHGDMDRNVALFSPYYEVGKFLDNALKSLATRGN
jgi:S1-C subfamily serine protease